MKVTAHGRRNKGNKRSRVARALSSLLGRLSLGDQRGSAILLEVVVATLLFALAVIPAFCSLSALVLAAGKAQVTSLAQALLQARVEEIKAQGWGSVPGDSLATTTVTLQHYKGTPFTIVETVQPTAMRKNPSDATSDCLVWRIILQVYREPVRDLSSPLGKVEFLFYAGGL